MSPPTVLLISDDADTRDLYAEWFARTASIATTYSRTVTDARRMVEVHGPDVVLLDLTRHAQWEDCAALTASCHRTPVVVLTGWVAGDGRFRQRAFNAGCAAFVAKPCHPRVLVTVLRRVLDGERHIAIT